MRLVAVGEQAGDRLQVLVPRPPRGLEHDRRGVRRTGRRHMLPRVRAGVSDLEVVGHRDVGNPAPRVRRTDPGDPDKCPVWQLHQVYSDESTHEWVQKGCRSAGIGCLECKQPVIEGILREQQPMLERAQKYMDDPSLLRAIVADGCDKARKFATETMRDVREAMGLSYS